MKLAVNNKVSFAELPGADLHRYYLTKRKGAQPVELTGVTTMMKRLGLTKGYGAVNPDVLARAASRGTAIHELLQGYEMGETVSSTIHYEWDCQDGTHEAEDEDCSRMLKKYSELSAQNFNALAIEYLVSDNESVASMIDFVSEVDENTVDLVDYKSSSSLDKEALAWQLSFYKYLFERQNKGISVRNLLGVHCHNEKVKIVPVSYRGDETVSGMLEQFKSGATDMPAAPIALEPALTIFNLLPGGEGVTLDDALVTIHELQARLKQLETQVSPILDQLKESMRTAGVSDVMVTGGRYVLVEEHTTTRFDTKRFKEAHPDMYDNYCVQSTTAASLKYYADK